MSRSSTAKHLLTFLVSAIAGISCIAQSALAAEDASAPDPVSPVVSGDFSEKTDTELTALTAQWNTLSPGERRHLLAVVRGRMEANRKAGRNIGVRVQRRYGRVVRKSDGSVVVQTRVVQVHPRGDDGKRRVTFGIGFEQRSRVSKSQQSSVQSKVQNKVQGNVGTTEAEPVPVNHP